MKILAGHAGTIEHLAFTPDGRFLAACRNRKGNGFDGLEFWDMTSGEIARTVAAGEWVRWFVLHPGGRWVYADTCRLDDDIALLDLATGEQTGLKFVAYRGTGVGASADGSRVVASVRPPSSLHPPKSRSETRDWLMCWRHAGDKKPRLAWKRQRTLREPIPYAVALLPGDRLVTYEGRFWGPEKGHISQLALRDATSGDYIETAKCEGADAVVASPDGSQVATRWGAKIQVWNAAKLSAKPVTITLAKDPGWYGASFEGYSFAFHPSGRVLAATANDATVTLYDTAGWKAARVLKWNAGKLRSVCFSPEGALAAAGSDTGKVVVWDVDA